MKTTDITPNAARVAEQTEKKNYEGNTTPTHICHVRWFGWNEDEDLYEIDIEYRDDGAILRYPETEMLQFLHN